MHWTGVLFGLLCAAVLVLNLRRPEALACAILLTVSWACSNVAFSHYGEAGPYLLAMLDGVMCGAFVLLHEARPSPMLRRILALYVPMFVAHLSNAARKAWAPDLYAPEAYFIVLNLLFGAQLAAVAAPGAADVVAAGERLLRAFSARPARAVARTGLAKPEA